MRPRNVPLVLIPGIVCDATVWAAQIEAFHGRFEVVVADHGDLDSLVDMAHALLRQAPASFALAGHSMGGRVALEIQRLAPERVTRLALLDTGYEALPTGLAGEQEIAKRRALLELAESHGMRAMGMEWARDMVHPERLYDASFMSRIHDMISRKTLIQFAAQVRALLNRPDAAQVLTAIRSPTLVLCGRQDTWAPWSRHIAMADLVVDSTLVGIERCGHMSTMEQPDAVNAALAAWLAS